MDEKYTNCSIGGSFSRSLFPHLLSQIAVGYVTLLSLPSRPLVVRGCELRNMTPKHAFKPRAGEFTIR